MCCCRSYSVTRTCSGCSTVSDLLCIAYGSIILNIEYIRWNGGTRRNWSGCSPYQWITLAHDRYTSSRNSAEAASAARLAHHDELCPTA